ncbi:MAG: DUF550 domain-containing protein [Cytophagaceae bacterium]|nr:DUF550 domain-containing protein [Cytophagaceae bacterium]
MLITDDKIVVTSEMMTDANMMRGGEFGIPVDPKDPSKGLQWKHAFECEDDDFEKIEEYFLNKANQVIDIFQLESERFAWSMAKFPEATALSSLLKMKEEMDEIEVELTMEQSFTTKEATSKEYADALMCLFDSAGRHGITPVEIFAAYRDKFEYNKTCEWVKNPDNTYSRKK